MTRYAFYVKGRPLNAKPYHLKGVGLPNVYLLNGVTIESDPAYGKLVTIENLPDLHRAIGLRLVTKPSPMTGDELRFLRKEMGLTQTALGKRLRVNHQTVANYEKGKTPETGPADIAMRFMYLGHVAPDEEVADLCKQLADDALEQVVGRARRKISGRWSDADGIRATA